MAHPVCIACRKKSQLYRLPDDHGCGRIERVLPHGKVEQERVICLEVLHVPEPLGDEPGINAPEIHGKVAPVVGRKSGKVVAGLQDIAVTTPPA